MTAEISFPRQQARTQRFTLGVPHSFSVSPDGTRIVFLRSKSGTDPVNCLWTRDTGGTERLIADPATLLAGADEDLPPEERARRERTRQAGEGVVVYATDAAVQLAAFTLSGRLFLANLADGTVRELPARGPVVDPYPAPTGEHVAYVAGGTLRVIAADGSGDRALAEPDGPEVTWGLPEFVAAEEMARTRGYWWSPDGQAILTTRVDTTPVVRWHICDPANPEQPSTELRYPVAGTPNALVTAHLAGLDGTLTPVPWDTSKFPYLAAVHWSSHGPLLLQLQTRDQRTTRFLAVNPDGSTTVAAEDTDPDWVDLIDGTPAWTTAGDLVRVTPCDGAYRLIIGGQPATPAGEHPLHVRSVLDVADDVLFTATGDDPTQLHVWTAGPGGLHQLTTEPGLHRATRGGPTTIISSSTLNEHGVRVQVLHDGTDAGTIASHAEPPVLTPQVELLTVGEHNLRCALVLPRGYRPGTDPKLPVLLDPYGGPAAQRVLATRRIYLESQWFADQGFAVLIIDGRGTPGRGPAWDRLIHYNQSTPNLEDQADGLAAVAATHPELDTSKVAIRGWSHGGYLAALAVLRRPDVFHAAVAGAPVTDNRWYDTHYTERYLGDPAEHQDAYEHDSLIADAPKLRRPLMLVHGFADDNVLVTHTLRLSAALLAAGRPHTVLPLTGITHMARQEEVAENLLLLQLDFLRRSLGLPG